MALIAIALITITIITDDNNEQPYYFINIIIVMALIATTIITITIITHDNKQQPYHYSLNIMIVMAMIAITIILLLNIKSIIIALIQSL